MKKRQTDTKLQGMCFNKFEVFMLSRKSLILLVLSFHKKQQHILPMHLIVGLHKLQVNCPALARIKREDFGLSAHCYIVMYTEEFIEKLRLKSMFKLKPKFYLSLNCYGRYVQTVLIALASKHTINQ
jgi:hypothetical protein